MFFDPSWPRKIPVFREFLPKKEYEGQTKLSPLFISLLISYAIVHISLPLRHWMYPGNTSWTEQGHMFSWRMMLRDKTGTVNFIVKDEAHNKFYPIKLRDYLTQRQIRDMTGKPDMILQFAHYLRDEYQKKFKNEVAVFASSSVALNGRQKQEMIRSGTNLALEKRKIGHYDWIFPLQDQKKELAIKE